MDGDAKARAALGTAGTASFLGGLGALLPGWNDLLLGLVNKITNAGLYELPSGLSWVLLSLGVVMLFAAFFGPARVAGWVDQRRGKANRESLLFLRHLGFSPAVRAPDGAELARSTVVPEVIDVPIDLAARLQAGDIDGALAEHQARMSVLETLRAAQPQTGLAYGGIVQAPFQVLAGYRLSNWAAVMLLEWGRARHEWRVLKAGPGPALGIVQTDELVGAGADVAVAFEISYPIATAQLTASVPAVGKIVRLSLHPPQLDALTHMEQATSIAISAREVLDDLAVKIGPGGRVHLFIAGPMSAGFRIGQMISRTLHPLVHVYAYTANAQPPYSWGLLINPANGGPVVIRP